MRGNGLRAAAYVGLVDVDPRIADELLSLLAAEGVAAYADATQGVRGPYLDHHLPALPTDRVFVDRATEATARSVFARHLPGLRAQFASAVGEPGLRADEQAAWEQLVASFHDRPDDHYRPPLPPPLPALRPVTKLACAGLLGGPALLVLAAALGWDLPESLLLTAVAGFVGGLVFLITRLKDRPPDDWDTGGGAVV